MSVQGYPKPHLKLKTYPRIQRATQIVKAVSGQFTLRHKGETKRIDPYILPITHEASPFQCARQGACKREVSTFQVGYRPMARDQNNEREGGKKNHRPAALPVKNKIPPLFP